MAHAKATAEPAAPQVESLLLQSLAIARTIGYADGTPTSGALRTALGARRLWLLQRSPALTRAWAECLPEDVVCRPPRGDPVFYAHLLAHLGGARMASGEVVLLTDVHGQQGSQRQLDAMSRIREAATIQQAAVAVLFAAGRYDGSVSVSSTLAGVAHSMVRHRRSR